MALDAVTATNFERHRVLQLEERLRLGEAWKDNGLVFTHEDGSPIAPRLLSSWFAQLSRDAGLPRIRLHDVPHSYATASLVAGIPTKVVSERLGHASIAITLDTYSHVLPNMQEEAAEEVAQIILGHRKRGTALLLLRVRQSAWPVLDRRFRPQRPRVATVTPSQE